MLCSIWWFYWSYTRVCVEAVKVATANIAVFVFGGAALVAFQMVRQNRVCSFQGWIDLKIDIFKSEEWRCVGPRRFPMCLCCLLPTWNCATCAGMWGRGVGSGAGWGQWIVGKGKLNLSMGLEWMEVHTLALKATTWGECFFAFGSPTHQLLYIVKYFIKRYKFFSSGG